ncbi:MAG: DivIVA domain-containing protein [Brooklawnia sp.]|uniref:DivIVA domain-containing protein n=1 Tax=Brooklawnia sp. TaxID=2699740 RepID=UPI003C7367D6
MGWVFAALIVVVIFFAVLAGLGRLGQLAPPVDDRPVPALPSDRPLAASDLQDVRFAVVTRGYSMPQVEALLDRVAGELADTEAVADTEAAADTPEPAAAAELAGRPQSDSSSTPRGSGVPAGYLGPVPNGWPTAP